MFVMNLYLKVPEYCSCGEEKNKLWHNCVHINQLDYMLAKAEL